MKIKENIAVSDTGFVFNPSTGESFTLNPMGAEIFSQMKDGKSEEEIKAFLITTYDVEEDTAEKDLYDFYQVLTKFQIIDNDGQ
jgi:hypothetical protein